MERYSHDPKVSRKKGKRSYQRYICICRERIMKGNNTNTSTITNDNDNRTM